MTQPAPVDVDFVFTDVVMDEKQPDPGGPKRVVIEFETSQGRLLLRLPTAGALELAAPLMRLPLEHHFHTS